MRLISVFQKGAPRVLVALGFVKRSFRGVHRLPVFLFVTKQLAFRPICLPYR